MTSEQILKDALTATAGSDFHNHAKILENAIGEAMAAHRTEVLNAFNEGENQGSASLASADWRSGADSY